MGGEITELKGEMLLGVAVESACRSTFLLVLVLNFWGCDSCPDCYFSA